MRRTPDRRILVTVLAWGFAALSAVAQQGAKNGEWRTYGGDLGNTHYSPLDQINAGNFDKLEVAWRFKTANLGPRPEFNLEATPLMANGVLYATAGTRRVGGRAGCRYGRASMDPRREGRRARQRGSAPIIRPRPGLLDRWPRGTDSLRHARLPSGRAECQDRRCPFPASGKTASST